MLCEPSSRPQTPFTTPSPHMYTHHHHAQFFPTSTPTPQNTNHIFSRPTFVSQNTTPVNFSGGNPSQPTPIPSLPYSHSSSQQQSLSVPPTPSCSSSTFNTARPNLSHSQSHTQKISTNSITRPKTLNLKKPSGSTIQKQKNVQLSLELKVEKAKGFHSFFVPLCKNLPPAPPCSPVNGHSPINGNKKLNENDQQIIPNNMDYFGSWNKSKSNDQWVEDISTAFNDRKSTNSNGSGDGMEVDAAH